MKNRIINVFVVLLIFIFAGCSNNNSYQNSLYNDNIKISEQAGAIKGDGVNSFGVRQTVLKAAIINKRY